MTERELLETKKRGLEKHLVSEACQKLSTARIHLDTASQSGLLNFQAEVEKARKAIDDAEQLWKETYNL